MGWRKTKTKKGDKYGSPPYLIGYPHNSDNVKTIQQSHHISGPCEAGNEDKRRKDRAHTPSYFATQIIERKTVKQHFAFLLGISENGDKKGAKIGLFLYRLKGTKIKP